MGIYEEEILKVLRGTDHSVRISNLTDSVRGRVESVPILPSIKFNEEAFLDALDNLLDEGKVNLNWRNRIQIVKEKK